MRFVIVITLFILSTPLFSQERGISAHLFTGVGTNHTGHSLARFGAEAQYQFANSIFAGFQSAWGINGNRTIARNVIWNGTQSLLIGRTNSISEKFSVQPYIGIGYQVSQQTEFTFEDASNLADDLISKGSNKLWKTFGDYNANAQRYALNRKTTWGIPVGVNFLVHKKSFGINLGMYVFASKYTEAGLRIGLSLGKL